MHGRGAAMNRPMGRTGAEIRAMDCYTRDVTDGIVAPPPGVPRAFAAVPEPPCGACDHRNHPGTECGISLADGSVCWCGTPAPELEPTPVKFQHPDEVCWLGNDNAPDADAQLRRVGHRVFLEIGLEGVGATLELDAFHVAGAVILLTNAHRHGLEQ